jgi:hypothetical protein
MAAYVYSSCKKINIIKLFEHVKLNKKMGVEKMKENTKAWVRNGLCGLAFLFAVEGITAIVRNHTLKHNLETTAHSLDSLKMHHNYIMSQIPGYNVDSARVNRQDYTGDAIGTWGLRGYDERLVVDLKGHYKP